MSWRSLGDVLESALAKALEVDGDAGVGAPAVSPEKSRRPKAPAKSREVRPTEAAVSLPANKGHANRRMATASKAGRPIPAVAIRLVVDNTGGRTTGEEAAVRPMLKPYRGDGRAILRLVSGGHASTSRVS